jgi:2-isopropylmalate synthase
MAAPSRTRSARIVGEVAKVVPGDNLGIHAHDDTGQAVANSLAAVEAGVRQIQGTLNGLGERCGNANLVTLIGDAGAEAERYNRRSLRAWASVEAELER